MARYDVDSRRRNAAGKLIGSHNGNAERWYKPMAHGHRTHSDGPPPAQNLRRKHQAQPPRQSIRSMPTSSRCTAPAS